MAMSSHIVHEGEIYLQQFLEKRRNVIQEKNFIYAYQKYFLQNIPFVNEIIFAIVNVQNDLLNIGCFKV